MEINTNNIRTLIDQKIEAANNKAYNYDTIKTGFDYIDDKLRGFSPGELIVIGSRPSMGKTQLLINLALNISKESKTLYYTNDLSESSLTDRFITSIVNKHITNEMLKDSDTANQINAFYNKSKFGKENILIADNNSKSIELLKEHCEYIVINKNINVVFIDYIQEITTDEHYNKNKDKIAHVIRELKQLAKKLNIVIVAASQLNRSSFYREGGCSPMMHDLRGSGIIEEMADKILLIHIPEYYRITEDEEGNDLRKHVQIIIAKNKSGKIGYFYIKRNSDFTNLFNIPADAPCNINSI